MNKLELINALRVPLFASRDSLAEAFDYAEHMFNSIGPEGAVAARTALHVVVNTVVKEIEKLDAVPAQAPDAVPAQAPEIDKARLAALIDMRIDAVLEDKINEAIGQYDFDELFGGFDIDDKIEHWIDNNLDLSEAANEWFEENGKDAIRDALADVEINVKIR